MSRTINGGRKVFFDLEQQRPNETHEQFMLRYLERVQVGMESQLNVHIEMLQRRVGSLENAAMAFVLGYILLGALLIWGLT